MENTRRVPFPLLDSSGERESEKDCMVINKLSVLLYTCGVKTMLKIGNDIMNFRLNQC
jgi:hypothetical protein